MSENHFGFDESTGAGKFMNAGINENVQITSIKYEPMKQGSDKMVIAITFTDPAGSTFVHKEFSPDFKQWEKLAKTVFQKDPKEFIKSEMNAMGERLKHILEPFIPAEQLVLKAPNFKVLAEQYIALAGNHYQGIPLRIKLILNNKDYTTFPKRAISPFVELMKEGVPTRLVLDPKYDRVVKKPKPDGDGSPAASTPMNFDAAEAPKNETAEEAADSATMDASTTEELSF